MKLLHAEPLVYYFFATPPLAHLLPPTELLLGTLRTLSASLKLLSELLLLLLLLVSAPTAVLLLLLLSDDNAC
jgi:hypothetical protein